MIERSIPSSFSDKSNSSFSSNSRTDAVTDLKYLSASSPVRFFLINAATGDDIMELKEETIINLAALPTNLLNIRADVSETAVQSVKFGLNERSSYRVENEIPYALFGDTGGAYNPQPLAPGQYMLTAITFGENGAAGNPGHSITIHFSVTEENLPPPSSISLFLVNADNGADVMQLQEGAIIDMNNLPTKNLNIRADVSETSVQSVRFGLNERSSYRVENEIPYALFGDTGGAYNSQPLAPGQYTLTATAFGENGAAGNPGHAITIHFTVTNEDLPPPASSISLFLVNADNGTDIMQLNEGAVIPLNNLPTANLNIRANVTEASVQSVKFGLNERSSYRVENEIPYALFGDTGGAYSSQPLAPGQYTLTATAFSQNSATGNPGPSITIHFTVTNEDLPPPASSISLFLVNADNGTDIMQLNEDAVIPLNNLPTANLNIRANVTEASVQSVKFSFNERSSYRVENEMPYALFGDTGGAYNSQPLAPGQYTLTATAFSQDGANGSPGSSVTINFELIGMTITDITFSLTDAGTGAAIMELEEGSIISMNDLSTTDLAIKPVGLGSATQSVRFELNGQSVSINEAPYTLPWTPAAGEFTLTATSFTEDNGEGTPGSSKTINFSVTESSEFTTTYIQLNGVLVLYNNTDLGKLDESAGEYMETVLRNLTTYFWRHTHMKLKLNWQIVEIDEYRNDIVYGERSDGRYGFIRHVSSPSDPDAHSVNKDLLRLGYTASMTSDPESIDFVHGIAPGCGNYAHGVDILLGKAGFFSTDLFVSNDIYNEEKAIHELNHVIDFMFNKSSHPLYPHNHVGQAKVNGEYAPRNTGRYTDLDKGILQYWDKWLDLSKLGRWGTIKTAIDRDRDGIPDNDPNVPLDERDLMSSDQSQDTDGDGLSDLQEAMQGRLGLGTNLTDRDSDNDGIEDNIDNEPLYAINTKIPFDRSLSLSDPITDWPLSGETSAEALYLAYDSDYLIIGFVQKSSPIIPDRLKINIDGGNDGLFYGKDNLEVILVGNTIGRVLVFDASTILPNDSYYRTHGYTSFHLPTTGFSGVTKVSDGMVTYQVMIPASEEYGLSLTENKKIGIRMELQTEFWDSTTCYPYIICNVLFDRHDYAEFTLGEQNHLAFEASGTAAKTAEVLLHPNPVVNELSVSWEDTLNPSEIRILDFSGVELIREKAGSEGSAVFDVSDLKPGIYSMQLIGPAEFRAIRFIKN